MTQYADFVSITCKSSPLYSEYYIPGSCVYSDYYLPGYGMNTEINCYGYGRKAFGDIYVENSIQNMEVRMYGCDTCSKICL